METNAKQLTISLFSVHMQLDEAKFLLGFPADLVLSPSQVKAAYRRMVWETHPDRFPAEQKAVAERKFKLISEAYTLLNKGKREQIVRERVPGRREWLHLRNLKASAASVPFLFIIMGALTLGGSTAARSAVVLEGLRKAEGGSTIIQSIFTLKDLETLNQCNE